MTDLPTHSLCIYLDVETPEYTVSHWASHMSLLSLSGTSFRIQFLHIPGHTPDSLAWYDIDEHHLYVGDIFYERKLATSSTVPATEKMTDEARLSLDMQGAIIFPDEGANLIQVMSSLDLLLSFVLHQNQELKRQHGLSHDLLPRVKIGCGHLTFDADAETMIREVQTLFQGVISGSIPVCGSVDIRDVVYDFWLESKEARYSVRAPRHLVQEAREHFHPKALLT
jgi:hypothetical protein